MGLKYDITLHVFYTPSLIVAYLNGHMHAFVQKSNATGASIYL